MALCFSKFSMAAEPLTRSFDGQTVTASHQLGQAVPSVKRVKTRDLVVCQRPWPEKGIHPPGVEEALLGNKVSALLL